ncbi:MAG TPA: hypothetical protein VG839_04840 [Asticcacaulis sp.]|nr:hypothetical protein [Asticcacaulis sp.]
MSAKPSFSLGRALSAAAASLPAAWGGAWLVLILLWAAGTFGMPFVVSMDVHVVRGGGVIGGGVGHLPVLLGFCLALFLLAFAARGAVYRAILFGKTAGKEGLGFGGLQFGLPELRLLVSDLLVGLFILVIMVALFIVFAVALATSGQGHGYDDSLTAIRALVCRHQGGDWVFIVYLIGSAILLIFLSLKLVLRHAATVAERRIVALNALGLSSGNVWKLLLGLIVIIIPFVLVAHGFMYLLARHMIAGFIHVGGTFYGPAMWMHAVMHALLLGVAGPLTAGFLSSAYRQIVDLRAK